MSDRVSLTNLQLLIRDSIVLAMPGTYWVTAEIAELKENYSGHCYLELVEKDPATESIRARARATIWAARYRTIKPQFEAAAGMELSSGLNVLLKVTVEYHELYGLSLNVSDIDPAYTMGGMALLRAEIIRRLREDGILEMNRELPFPFLPQRIAVVSSATSAGFADFSKQLADNQYGFAFVTELFNSPMQGEDTEKGVVEALNLIAEKADRFDLAVILRGGGSVSDLRWFDNYSIAFHVTQFPLPVLTGIGHDKDVSVTDMVAWKALKTPTAAADFIIGKMAETDNLISDHYANLRAMAEDSIRERNSSLLGNARRLLPATHNVTSGARKITVTQSGRIASLSSAYLRKAMVKTEIAKSQIKNIPARLMESYRAGLRNSLPSLQRISTALINRLKEDTGRYQAMIRMADPVNIVKKGFTITQINGRPVMNSSQLKPGDLIVTRFRDGEIDSEVKTRKIKKNPK